jgi:small subunit ribosomal protein S18
MAQSETQMLGAQIQRLDYKDVETLKKFLNPHGKILARRRTGLSAAGQRSLSEAVKRARFMALLPFIVR